MTHLEIKEIRKKLGLTQGQLAKEMGVGTRTVQKWEGNETKIKPATEILLKSILKRRTEGVTNTKKQNTNLPDKRVPYYEIDVTATNIESFEDIQELPEYDIDFKPFNDCVAMLPIVGDSMFPEYKNGDIIAIKEAPSTHIMYGETHLIITREGFRTVKKIRKSKDKDYVILMPINPNYDEAEILKSDIVKLYIVKGQFKKHTY